MAVATTAVALFKEGILNRLWEDDCSSAVEGRDLD